MGSLERDRESFSFCGEGEVGRIPFLQLGPRMMARIQGMSENKENNEERQQ